MSIKRMTELAVRARKHKCQLLPTERRHRIDILEHIISSWYCGDYDDNPEQKQAINVEGCIVERNKELAHVKEIGHCTKCGYPM